MRRQAEGDSALIQCVSGCGLSAGTMKMSKMQLLPVGFIYSVVGWLLWQS
jgi:hypothetical protein